MFLAYRLSSCCDLLILIGQECENENPVLENRLPETQQPVPEVNDGKQFEDLHLIARARAVGVQYEFAQHGLVETEDDKRKRQRRNQTKIRDEEKRLREVVGGLPPPQLAGSSEQEDNVLFVHLRWSR